MEWKTVLAYITGTVDQELLLRNEYLVAENRILRNQVTGRVRLTNGDRMAELFWLNHTGRDIYCGQPRSSFKRSYHASGKFLFGLRH